MIALLPENDTLAMVGRSLTCTIKVLPSRNTLTSSKLPEE
ncbi:Uncharacterised protein [Vibrio cholerae]|nr:Uncharacterised protein [Vibrio cholerae]